MKPVICIVYPWAHSPLVSNVPHSSSFQAIGTGSGILGFCPCWCSSPFFQFAFHISRCFSTYSSSSAIGFHSCFFVMTDVSAPIWSTLLLTHFLGEFPVEV